MKVDKLMESGLWAFEGFDKVRQLFGKSWAFKSANLFNNDGETQNWISFNLSKGNTYIFITYFDFYFFRSKSHIFQL